MARSTRFHTRLCDDLGIDVPIVQSGMGGVAGPELAAEVSNAGGLGIASITLQTPEAVARTIAEMRERTDRPFGVNLLIPSGLKEPIDVATLPGDLTDSTSATLNAFRAEHDLEPGRKLRTLPAWIDDAVEVVAESAVPVLSLALGEPTPQMVEDCHRAGTKVMAMVTSVLDGKRMADLGVDVIVAQGREAGGHRSHLAQSPEPDHPHDELGTFALVPELVAAVQQPVVAAGGIVNGRGLLAAIVLGASGVLMGSRFVATRESLAPAAHKKMLLEHDGATTELSTTYSGWPARLVPNAYTRHYDSSGAPTLPFPLHYVANADIRSAGEERNDPDLAPLWAGQAVGQIGNESWAGEVISEVIHEAREILGSELADRVGL